MSELSPEEIDHLAKLARITLSAEEKKDFAKQLPKILDFVDQLRAVPGVKDKSSSVDQAISLADLRADELSTNQLSLEDLKKLAPAWNDDQLEVPAVFGGENDEG